jgi:RNA polymerase sigma factor (sigma-70 family)
MQERAQPDEVDVAALYPQLSARLLSLVARNVIAPPAVIEEACQVAWSQLHTHRGRVESRGVFGWLATTAMREALRMLRLQKREASLEDPVHWAEVIALPVPAPGPDRVVEMREQLAEVRQLPVRQRQMLWLHGLGYEYGEISAQTGDSRRTVERQLLRAKRSLKRRPEARP